MEQGLIVDSLRGMCGTGIYGWNSSEKEGSIFKRALPGADFVNSRQFDLFRAGAHKFDLVIGHNRASTIGAAKDQNCHPFRYGDITLVHNGTLNQHSDLDKGFNHAVDSAHAANAINKLGAVPALEKVRGAFVFVWHNAATNTFHMARNSMRDIWYIVDKEGETLYYASEYSMLHWLLERNKLEIPNEKYRSLVEHTMYTWELGKSFRKPKLQKFEEAKSYIYQGRGANNWGSNRDEEELKELNIDQFSFIPIKEVTFFRYGERSAEGRIEAWAYVPQKDNTIKRIKAKAHSIRVDQWEAIKDKDIEMCVTSRWNEGDTPVLVARSIRPAAATSAKSPSKETPKEDDEGSANPKLGDFFRGPNNRVLSKKEFQDSIRGGCCYCGDPIDDEDDTKVMWFKVGGDYEPMCLQCGNNTAIRREVSRYYNNGIDD